MRSELFASLGALTKTAFTTSQYSTPLNPVILSGASDLPPMRVPSLRAPVQKTGSFAVKEAASAPTRGNFMMASDLPGWRQPRLDTAVQKNAGGITALPGGLASKAHKTESDFPAKKLNAGEKIEHEHTSRHALARSIAMDHLTEDPQYYEKLRAIEKKAQALRDTSTEQLAVFVEELRKQADVSPAVSWNGQFGGAHRQQSDIPAFRAPILSRAVQKHANVSSPRGQLSKTQHIGAPKVTAPPGPSIADIAKPKGEHFGIGIPGAFKGKI
jgi:hypothetical protein